MSAYLRLFTPINLVEERERFFAATSYQPQLRYDWSEATLAAVISENPTIKPLADALVAQDSTAIRAAAMTFFEIELRPADLALAEAIIKTLPKETNATAEQLASYLETILQQLEIDYNVILTDQAGFLCRPNHDDQTITISRHSDFNYIDVTAAAKHELVHVIRAVNGKANGITPELNYLPTEEGLACLLQDHYTVNGHNSLFQHAIEYYAAHLADTKSMREIYDWLRERGLNKDLAWQRGIRQKYGLRDTTQPGGILKSAMYFYHEQLLTKLKPEELLRLFVGKISQLSLERYPKYEGIIPENVVRQFCGF